MAELLVGKKIADKIKNSLKEEIKGFEKAPRLMAIAIGENKASDTYMRSQKLQAEKIGIKYDFKKLDGSTTPEQAKDVIDEMNRDESVDAVIVQFPVPKTIDMASLIHRLDPFKDAEGVHPDNIGKIVLKRAKIAPCTAKAVIAILEEIGIDLYGKEAVCVGHSSIVGKPLSIMLMNKMITTTVCHVATYDKGKLPDHVKRADILIVAIGKPGIVHSEWIKEGCVIIDVGINHVDGKIVGDVDFESAAKKAAFITPVPGGVGPLTTAMLLGNVVELYKSKNENG